MARVAAAKESIEKALKDESKPWAKLFSMAEAKTGIDRLYIFLGQYKVIFFHNIFYYYYYNYNKRH